MGKDITRTVVDAGNTRVKIAQFKNEELVFQNALDWSDKELPLLLQKFTSTNSIFCSVAEEQKNNWLTSLLQPKLEFTQQTHVPIDLSQYKTVNTLGTDRIANAVAANHFSKTQHALIIDCGTCIKFDFISNSTYYGGSISPGVRMRFQALHEFTGKLPLLDTKSVKQKEIIGNSTASSISSGVLYGTQKEIEGFIEHYTKNYEELTIFLTGGDAKLFELHNKNTIFVDSYMTLKGLFLILKHNGY